MVEFLRPLHGQLLFLFWITAVFCGVTLGLTLLVIVLRGEVDTTGLVYAAGECIVALLSRAAWEATADA